MQQTAPLNRDYHLINLLNKTYRHVFNEDAFLDKYEGRFLECLRSIMESLLSSLTLCESHR